MVQERCKNFCQFRKAHGISTNCHGARTAEALPLTTVIRLLNSLLLASARPLKIKYMTGIQFMYVHAQKHSFSPINQCNSSFCIRAFKCVCKTHSPHLQCTLKRVRIEIFSGQNYLDLLSFITLFMI